MKKKIVYSALIFFCSMIYSQEKIETLLQGYFEQSIELKKLSAQLENAVLENSSQKISNGWTMTLSSGTVQISGGEDKNIKFSPKVSLGFPAADNLKITGSSVIKISDDEDSKIMSSNSAGVSFDIIGSTMRNRKISLEQSGRNVLEAERNLQDGFISQENQFYKNLKNLYSLYSKINSTKKELYEDKISFEQIKARGFSEGSSKYRLSQMEVLEDEHNIENYQRDLEREIKVFASKCGITNVTEIDKFLPENILYVKPVQFSDFNINDFKKIETAFWNNSINEKKRNAEKSFTLTGNTGVTFANDIQNEYKNTVDGGISCSWNDSGLTANAEVNVPLDGSDAEYSFGISISPNSFRQKKITNKQKKIQINREQIEIQNAQDEYETAQINYSSEMENLLWNREKNLKTNALYKNLAEDSKNYFAKGLISESEYKSALVNYENSNIQCILDNINIIIYNNEVSLLFNRNSGLSN